MHANLENIIKASTTYPLSLNKYVAYTWKHKAQKSIDWWMNKEDVVYIHNGILLSNKKEWSLAIYNDLDGVREKEAPYDFTHMWNLRNKTNEQREKEREKETNKETGS